MNKPSTFSQQINKTCNAEFKDENLSKQESNGRESRTENFEQFEHEEFNLEPSNHENSTEFLEPIGFLGLLSNLNK